MSFLNVRSLLKKNKYERKERKIELKSNKRNKVNVHREEKKADEIFETFPGYKISSISDYLTHCSRQRTSR